MRLVVQRVSEAKVEVEGKLVGKIGRGLLLLIGVEEDDADEDINWLSKKVISMRIFNDAEGKMNLSVQDVDGQILAISQFTLHASTKKGNRPSFIRSARSEKAERLYEDMIKSLEVGLSTPVEKGIFGAHMKVSLVNDGPVTITLDSKRKE